jgi:hypothetical protein
MLQNIIFPPNHELVLDYIFENRNQEKGKPRAKKKKNFLHFLGIGQNSSK